MGYTKWEHSPFKHVKADMWIFHRSDIHDAEKHPTCVLSEEYYKKRSDKIVDALYIAACWMPDNPDVQYPLKDL